MSSQLFQQATAKRVVCMPVGSIDVVDPHPLNWLFITRNAMKELVRPDARPHRRRGDGVLPLDRRHDFRARRDRAGRGTGRGGTARRAAVGASEGKGKGEQWRP